MRIGKFGVSSRISNLQIDQLIYYSNTDSVIRKFTSDAKRFLNRSSYEKWKKERNVYILSDNSNDLFGIVWFGEKEIPKKKFIYKFDSSKYGITFAVRIYGEARGKGLSANFIEEAMRLYKRSEDFKKIKNQCIWLETNKDNLPAINSYKRVGFEQVSEPDNEGRILMAKLLP
ncbi:MAG TPA: GNAT family N-acetyltransferase [Patescibacteria group bacterium]|nr:GNAT family N-acetyltransferase [Patescibacteria group bacterium]